MNIKHLCLALCLAMALAAASPAQSTQPATTFSRPHLSAPLPTAAGHTRLRYYTTIDGKSVDMCVVVSNSRKIAAMTGKVPTMLFLHGAGDKGSSGDRVFDNGPNAEMLRHPELQEGLGLMVVSPQCPADRYWTAPGMDGAMSQLLDLLLADGHIDPDRFYLSGLSAGGRSVYLIAGAAPTTFAALAPVAPALIPDVPPPGLPPRKQVVEQVKNFPIWIITGANDGRFAADSRIMADALTKAGADVTLSELSGEGHQCWDMVYPKLEFYDWLSSHVRGQTASRKYTTEELLKIASAPLNDPIGDKLVKDLATFAPNWQMVNCARESDVGLHDEAMGRKSVMVLRPLNGQTACRIQTTWQIAPGKHGQLHFIAGHDQGDWQMTVVQDGREVLSRKIDESAANAGWLDSTIDLGPAINKSRFTHLDVLIGAAGEKQAAAYLAKLAVEFQDK